MINGNPRSLFVFSRYSMISFIIRIEFRPEDEPKSAIIKDVEFEIFNALIPE
jgi:hypothetical protein